MCYIHNSFSMLLITFYALLVITFLFVKIVKDFEKIVFVSRSDSDFIKEIMYFFATFLYVEIKIFVDFFLNRELVNFLIIFLNIILKMNKWFSLFVFSAFSRT